MVAYAWICEKMRINIKIKHPSRMIWRHFGNDSISNAINDKGQQSEFVPTSGFRNDLLFIGAFVISSEYGHKIISKLSIKEDLKQAADEWFNKYITGSWVAVHYRGTDVEVKKKGSCIERYRIELDNYIKYLASVLDDHISIFACSDQAQFIDKMKQAFPARVFARDIERSYDSEIIHLHWHLMENEQRDNFNQEKDALIDLLILAKAELIYTTGSGFVDVVRYFNPKVKVVSMDGRIIGKGKNNIPMPRKDVFDKLSIPL